MLRNVIIPDGWDEVPVKNLIALRRGRVISHEYIAKNQGDYPVYSSQTKNDGVMGHIASFDFEGPHLTWTTDGANAGTVFFRHGQFNCTNVCGAGRPIDPEVADVRFLAFYLDTVAKSYVSYVGNPKLMSSVFASISALLPPIAEQRAIAEALSDIDDLIASLDALLAKKEAIKQGMMQELLTGKRRLSGFAGEWDKVRLSCLGKFLKGSGVRKNEAKSGAIACVRYGELYTRHNDVIRQFHSSVSTDVADTATVLQHRDILFAGSGETKEEIGKCAAFVDNMRAVAGGDIVILRNHGQCAEFLGYALNAEAIQRQKASFAQGDAVVHISASNLGKVIVRLPKMDEQQRIAEVMLEADREIAGLRSQSKKLHAIREGMSQQLLTGRVRLK